MKVEILGTEIEGAMLTVKAYVCRELSVPRMTDLRAELLALRDELTRMLTGPCVPKVAEPGTIPRDFVPPGMKRSNPTSNFAGSPIPDYSHNIAGHPEFSGKPAKRKAKAKGKR